MSPYPPSRFPMVYFLYDGMNGKQTIALQNLVKTAFPHVHFMEPWIPMFITNEQVGLWESHLQPFLVPNSLLVGIGRAGLAASYLQERFPELNLSVLAINAPTSAQDFTLSKKPDNRVALYSSRYEPIQGKCENWTDLSTISFDVSWLQHGILSESGGNLCKHSAAFLVIAYMKYAKESEFVETFSRIIKDGEYEAYVP